MRIMIRLLVLAVVASCATVVVADELRIPLGQQGQVDESLLPQRGISMDRVRAAWGEPRLIHDAVGQPPITRWDYPGFSVYFEYRHVVHAVVRHHRANAAGTSSMEQ